VLRPFRDLPREVAVLSAVAFAVAVGFGIVAPAIPVFAREFGVSRTAAGAVISVFAFMRLISAPGAGALVDRFGERRILATGIGIVAVSSALAGLSQSYQQLLVLRGLGGIGSAMFTVGALGLLLRVVGPEGRARATSMWQGGFIIGGITGPALGGVLTSISTRAPFFVYAITLAVAGTVALMFLAHTHLREKEGPDHRPQRTSLRSAVRSSAYRAAVIGNFGTGWSLFGVRTSLIPLFVIEGLHRDPFWTGIGFVLSALAEATLLLPAGHYSDRSGRRPLMILGQSVVTASVLLLVFSSSLPTYLISMALFGAGFACIGPSTAAVVGDVVQGRGGTVVATYQMAADFGAVVGPLVAGWLADSYSYGAAFFATATVVASGLVASVLMVETHQRGSRDVAPAS
jgi:MFS family permease